MTARSAIVGLGMTEMTRSPIGDNPTLAARAIRLALEDAGLEKAALDGLLINAGVTRDRWFALALQSAMGLRDLKLLSEMGCHYAQGHLLGLPLEKAQVRNYLADKAIMEPTAFASSCAA